MNENRCPFCKNFLSRKDGIVLAKPYFVCIHCGHEFVNKNTNEWICIEPERRKEILKNINLTKVFSFFSKKISGSSYNAKYNMAIIDSLERTKSSEYVERLVSDGFKFYPLTKDEILSNNDYVNYYKKYISHVLDSTEYYENGKIIIKNDFLEEESDKVVKIIEKRKIDIPEFLGLISIYIKFYDLKGFSAACYAAYKMGYDECLDIMKSIVEKSDWYILDDEFKK